MVTVKYANLTRDTEVIGKMDPYCRLRCRNTEHRTRTANRMGKHPVWNEVFNFIVYQSDNIHFSVFDKDNFSRDDFIGEGSIPVFDAFNGEICERQYPMFYKGKQSGMITVGIKFLNTNNVQQPNMYVPNVNAIPTIPYNQYPNMPNSSPVYAPQPMYAQSPMINSQPGYMPQPGYAHYPTMNNQPGYMPTPVYNQNVYMPPPSPMYIPVNPRYNQRHSNGLVGDIIDDLAHLMGGHHHKHHHGHHGYF